MTTVNTTFDAAGVGPAFTMKPGQSVDYAVTGTFTGFARLQRSSTQGQTWETEALSAADTAMSGTVKNEGKGDLWVRFRAEDTDDETPITGDIETSISDVVDTLQEIKAPSGDVVLRVTDAGIETPQATRKIIVNAAGQGKVGATAGFVVAAGDDVALVTCPAEQTAATLVVPLTGLKVGEVINAFHLLGQIESAGGTVTVDADLRKHTTAAADVADASVGTITQVEVTADTALGAANSRVASLGEVVAEDATYYVLITATTAAATDIALQGVAVEVTPAP